jgi:pyruvate ferredoxin oxidoreductase alpha subunit
MHDLSASLPNRGHCGETGGASMVRKLLTGNAAAAWGARLADVDYVPAFPITPQTEIIELLSEWCADSTLPARFVLLDSEHSLIMAAGAAAATGVRTFTATSSQGLVYAMEALYTVAGWRVPFVLVNVSRGLSAPITLGPDHNDVLAARDTGFIQLHAETCQEVLDSVLMAYRIAEDARVSLPVLVNMDGFYLSFTREAVDIPDAQQVRQFLPPFEPKHPVFRGSRPVAQGVAVLDGSNYSYFRYQMHCAVENALQVHSEVAEEFANLFGRRYAPVETYRLEDAETVVVMSGSFTTKGKAAVDRWRERRCRVGLVRLRMIRPRPTAALAAALSGRRAIGVIDQNLSPGLGGILFQEVAAAVAGVTNGPVVLRSFVGGLGGREIRHAEFDHIIETLQTGQPSATSTEAELLFTRGDRDHVQQSLAIAGKPGSEPAAP